MRPTEFDSQNGDLGKPIGWDEATMGQCESLPVRFEGDSFHSVWQPTQEELALMAAGEPVQIVLTVVGSEHPPVCVQMIPATSDGLEIAIEQTKPPSTKSGATHQNE